MTWTNLRRLSNTDFYCKSELNFIPYKDLRELIWITSTDVSPRLCRQSYSVFNCPENQKRYPFIWYKSPVQKIRQIISSFTFGDYKDDWSGTSSLSPLKGCYHACLSGLLFFKIEQSQNCQPFLVGWVFTIPDSLLLSFEFPPVSTFNAVLWSGGSFFLVVTCKF